MSTSADQPSPEQIAFPREALPADMTDDELGALIEAVLLVSPEPPTLDEIATGCDVPIEDVEAGLNWLEAQTERGWVVQRHGRRISLTSHPRFADRIRQFLGLDREARLSAASLETLALVAYQQPVTRSEIERIRGVDSSGVLATLHARGLIEPVARLATVGNPIQYGTTADFLSHFGLQSVDDLPPIGMIDGKDGAAMLESARADVILETTDHETDDSGSEPAE